MNDRMSAIWSLICSRGDSISIRKLASRFGVSERTIYYDLSRISDELQDHGIPRIEIERGRAHRPATADLDSAQGVFDAIPEIAPPQARRLRELELICSVPKIPTVDEIANRFEISRNTAMRDLDGIRELLGPFGVSLEGGAFQRLTLSGDEGAIRSALTAALEGEPSASDGARGGLPRAGASLDLVRRMGDELGVKFSDASLSRLVTVLRVVSLRLAAGAPCPLRTEANAAFLREEQAILAHEGELADLLGAHPGDREIGYLAAALASASVVQSDGSLSENWVGFSVVTDRIIREMERSCPGASFAHDRDLFEGVLNHLGPACRRAEAGERAANPMRGFVERRYGRLNEAMARALAGAGAALGVTFPEDEVAFFTMFFAASLERSGGSRRRIGTIVVCDAGMATSELLRAKLASRFDVDVLGTFSVDGARAWLAGHEVDLVLSTVPFAAEGRRAVRVDPTLPPDDEGRVSRAIGAIADRADADAALGAARRHGGLGPACEAGGRDDSGSTAEGSPNPWRDGSPTLADVLDIRAMEAGFPATDRDAAIRRAGELLAGIGRVEGRYVDAMVESARRNGAYIAVAPGIALPHARVEDGSRGLGMSVVALREAVPFGHPLNDPIGLVIGLCGIDHRTHLRALSELMAKLRDTEVLIGIAEARDAGDIARALGAGPCAPDGAGAFEGAGGPGGGQ